MIQLVGMLLDPIIYHPLQLKAFEVGVKILELLLFPELQEQKFALPARKIFFLQIIEVKVVPKFLIWYPIELEHFPPDALLQVPYNYDLASLQIVELVVIKHIDRIGVALSMDWNENTVGAYANLWQNLRRQVFVRDVPWIHFTLNVEVEFCLAVHVLVQNAYQRVVELEALR